MSETKRSTEGWIYLVLFIGSVWLANYLITHVGVQFAPGEPFLIPVGFGIMAPSGVLAIGLGFTLRDLVQRRLGKWWTIVGIIIGAALSYILSPAVALASGTAFFLSEMADLFVYTPLSKKHLLAAVLASNTVGLIIDSSIFLYMAFGSLAFIQGQIVGKLEMTLLALPVVMVIRAWIRRGVSYR
jgi:hypothetical protein